MNLFKKLFSFKSKTDSVTGLEVESVMSKENFATINSDKRLATIMALGDTGQLKFYELIKYSILSDNNENVRFAALKRIHLFKEHSDLIPFLKSLQLSGNSSRLEPYLSMALSRAGIITQEEFKNRITAS